MLQASASSFYNPLVHAVSLRSKNLYDVTKGIYHGENLNIKKKQKLKHIIQT